MDEYDLDQMIDNYGDIAQRIANNLVNEYNSLPENKKAKFIKKATKYLEKIQKKLEKTDNKDILKRTQLDRDLMEDLPPEVQGYTDFLKSINSHTTTLNPVETNTSSTIIPTSSTTTTLNNTSQPTNIIEEQKSNSYDSDSNEDDMSM